MQSLKQYFWNLLISIDQLANTIFGGDPDETISSRVGKAVYWHNDRGWKYYLSKFLDLFQKKHTLDSIEPDEGEKRDGK